VTAPPDLSAPAHEVAPRLLGCRLLAGGVAVRLTEVEAYSGEGADPASHAHRGQTARNSVMFGRAGLLYVYFTYGMHWCLNVVTGEEGRAAAVLLRAGEVVAGHDTARRRRPGSSDRDLCRGPARLAKALGVDGSHLGVDVLDPASPVRLLPAEGPSGEVVAGPRVGVAAAPDTPWRFWLQGEASVSSYRPAVRRVRA
jgi:DNA-3-methyladenine glycosylase